MPAHRFFTSLYDIDIGLKMNFIVIIPARYSSTRLPGKPLIDLCGKTMIQRVAEKALQSGAQKVIVATDSGKVADAVNLPGVEVVMTSPDHSSGTERLAEVCSIMNFSEDQIIVNVQGDEPLIPPVLISQVAQDLADNDAPMATLAVPITDESEVFNPNAVKVIMNRLGDAIYFSRAPIPYERNNFARDPKVIDCSVHARHLGIYAYRAGFLKKFVKWEATPLEDIEKLEQLRTLSYGEKIHVSIARVTPPAGIDTDEDRLKVIEYLKQHPEA
jgi:3-deoxy-manno-octulosonate cytidylyltransferase (CMP-KDO synthetase)